MSLDPMAPGWLPLVPSDTDDPALASVFDVFRDRGREPPVLYRTLANAPAMLDAWTALAWPLRNAAATPRRLRELAIMRVGQLTGAEAEWLAHWPMAVQHGVTEDQLGSLARWRESGLFTDDERALLAFVDELTIGVRATQDAFSVLAEHFDDQQIVELTLTAAFYSCVSRVLGGLGLRPKEPDDQRLAFVDGHEHGRT